MAEAANLERLFEQDSAESKGRDSSEAFMNLPPPSYGSLYTIFLRCQQRLQKEVTVEVQLKFPWAPRLGDHDGIANLTFTRTST